MKSILSFCALVLFVSQTALADSPPFFQVEKDGQVSYVLGYVPNGLSDIEKVPEVVAKHFMEATTYVVESDPNPSEEVQEKLLPLIGPGEEDSLRNLMTTAEWELFLNRLLTPNLQLNAKIIDGIQERSLILAVNQFKSARIQPAEQSIEATLINVAAKTKKPVMMFESAEETVNLLAKVATADYLKALLQRNETQWADSQAAYESLLAAYYAGDITAIDKAAKAFYSSNEYEVMINERSSDWAEKFDSSFSPEGSEFYLLPIDLLVSAKGLFAKLAERGYKVTRFTYPPVPVETPTPAVEVPATAVPAPATPVPDEDPTPEVPTPEVPGEEDPAPVDPPKEAPVSTEVPVQVPVPVPVPVQN